MFLLGLLLSSCSSVSNKAKSKQVIPAYVDPSEREMPDSNQSTLEEDKDSIMSESAQKRTLTKASKYILEDKPLGNSRDIPSPEIVRSLIERAEKAITLKQWLRAQHILEQALHIAPSDAKVFLIYGDVYLNLGILDQAEQMYRRARLLAGDTSSLGRLAIDKLNALNSEIIGY